MSAPSYLLKSRHGIYYFRMRALRSDKQSTNSCGDIRISLRTRDKKRALYLSRKIWIAMTERAFANTSSGLFEWEAEEESEREKYFRGKKLMGGGSGADPNDPIVWSELTENLTQEELEDYVFAWEHDEEQRQKKRRQTARLIAEAVVGSGLRTPSELAPQGSQNASLDNDAELQDAITRFLSAGNRAAATLRSYSSRLALFQHIISAQVKGREARVSQITYPMVRHYADCVRRLPRHFELGSGVKLSSVLVAAGTGISPKTIAFHFGVVRALFLWLEDQHYPIAPKLARIFGTVKVSSKKTRYAFEPQELKLLFESSEYLQGTFKRASDYWVPLIGAFTGARESEICQLHTSDILHDEETGLAVFHFNADDDKRQKSDGDERKVPVHPVLERLGLIAYAEQLRSANIIRLFPDEKRNERGEFASFSKRFNRYKVKCGIQTKPTRRKDFHSFRHNVSGQLRGKGCPSYVINDITGHSQAKESHAITTYGGEPILETLNDWLNRLDYKIDFAKIRSNGWKKCLTGKR